MENKWKFVFDTKNKGWWLHLTTVEQLIEYVKATQGSRSVKAFELYWTLAKNGQECKPVKSVREVLEDMPQSERMKLMLDDLEAWNRMYGAIMMAENTEGATILDGFRLMNMETGSTYLRHIREDGEVFINRVGGCTFGIEWVNSCERDELVFPDFTEKDIHVKQWQGGNHWYSFLGGMPVRVKVNGELKTKWNTRKAAEDAARAMLQNA